MLAEWILPAHLSAFVGIAISVLGMYLTLILFARFSGVRSFAEMSTFDIAVTIALGSLLATVVAAKNPPLFQGMFAMIMLYLLQLIVSRLRKRCRSVSRLTDNAPVLLMGPGGEMKPANMHVARITEDDLRTHLRKANVVDRRDIQAVVMEGTGTINVLSSADGRDVTSQPNNWILEDVRDYTK